ncbi:hypothetical protein [Bartonella apis]|uniref:hypothetical protein n=1 Tax=Bartonella apis TaxID=1686310 RepID=UPI00117783F3|nr:hypothetical protein [Bartonella apis]
MGDKGSKIAGYLLGEKTDDINGNGIFSLNSYGNIIIQTRSNHITNVTKSKTIQIGDDFNLSVEDYLNVSSLKLSNIEFGDALKVYAENGMEFICGNSRINLNKNKIVISI